MLIGYNNDITRVQSPFIETDEIEAICKYLSKHQSPESKPYILPKTTTHKTTCTDNNRAKDPLFAAAAMYFIGRNCASCSDLQREFFIGYNRASHIMKQLEENKVISRSKDGKPRNVLMTGREFLEKFLK